ncbi:Ankyrin repeat-containing YAR1 [Hyphodiscus hymeniophilus]|uniref:Ankyrin repeat-containing YAR1 n=1 Tax=Hyphodiscus hymeniophilus TaxID=353542 RepID=A0A9P6VEY6_9HELO|nr:Ankyrin repeat-containing YAR1 [Hyphodiscus hymeniophilus]
MAPIISEDEIDDLLYLARVGEKDDLIALINELGNRESCTIANLLEIAKDDTNGNGVLHMAAANGHNEILKFFLDSLSKPSPQNPTMLAILNAQNQSGNTALHWAALNGHLESVKILLDHGADPTLANQKGHDAVYEAELNDKKEVVEWVLKEGGEGLEEGFGGDSAEGDGGERAEIDADQLSRNESGLKLEVTMDKMDIKEGSAPVKA